MPALILLFFTALFAYGLTFALRRDWLPRRLPRWAWALYGLLALAGGGLTWQRYGQMQSGLARERWPVVQGTVTESQIIGKLKNPNVRPLPDPADNEGPARPRVRYRYEVEGESYTGESNFNAPGFGARSHREAVAAAHVGQHPVGSTVAVRYNPRDFAESRLVAVPPWYVFGQLSLGLILYGVGVFGLTGRGTGERAAAHVAPGTAAPPTEGQDNTPASGAEISR